VNGDGYDDILIGSFPGGEAFVFHGNANGVNATPSWVENGDGSGAFGQSVSTAGDVNGDGYSDVIVGAPYYNGGQASEGKVYVYQGGDGGGRPALDRGDQPSGRRVRLVGRGGGRLRRERLQRRRDRRPLLHR
jgi:hypothetical protein